MSLLTEFMVPCKVMDKVRTPDGEGGFTSSYQESAEILAAIVNSGSTLTKIAEQQGVTSSYLITTIKSVKLEFHDIIKRISDGKYFRITSESGEHETPSSSSLDIAQYTAEKWEMTS